MLRIRIANFFQKVFFHKRKFCGYSFTASYLTVLHPRFEARQIWFQSFLALQSVKRENKAFFEKQILVLFFLNAHGILGNIKKFNERNLNLLTKKLQMTSLNVKWVQIRSKLNRISRYDLAKRLKIIILYQISGLMHLQQDVTASNKFALEEDLRKCWPFREVLYT